jgi:D-psicose/D-tagatose/L-ribulose 3-epimerase
MTLRYAYNTNGLQSHRLEDALHMIADSGYHGVALTLDHMHLDPLYADAQVIRRVKRILDELNLKVVIETGARFVLDPLQKHGPSLCDPNSEKRLRRLNLLKKSIEIAADLNAPLVNFAAGPRDRSRTQDEVWPLFIAGVDIMQQRAVELGVQLTFEPEPGHWIQSLSGYDRLQKLFPNIRLTIDVSHVSVCCKEGTPQQAIARYSESLGMIHLEDAPVGVHQHLPFGEGELDIKAILAQLHKIQFQGLCAIELSRHSHAAHQMVSSSIKTLQKLERTLNG